MTALKAHQADAFLRSPDSKISAFLLYGTDAGLVAERGAALAALLAKRETPPGEVLRFDDVDLETDPDRLAVELGTIPMFGGRKIVRAATGRRLNAGLLKPLVEGAALDGLLIVETGNLRPDEALRALFEKSARAIAIPCYVDEGREIEALIREHLAAEGLRITPAAKELLSSRLGADRALSRAEIEKLALYAKGKGEIGIDDVEAIVGDASELAIERIVNAAVSGDGARAVTELARALAAGESAQGVILAAERYVQRLHRVRALLDSGRPFDDAVRALKPAPHFKQKDALQAHCRIWSSAELEAALARIAAAAKTARTAGSLEDVEAERLLLALAARARRKTASEMPRPETR